MFDRSEIQKSVKNFYMIAYNEITSNYVDTTEFKKYEVAKNSEFFENAYILDLIKSETHAESKYFAVLSPAFFNKACAGRVTTSGIVEKLEKGLTVPTSRFSSKQVEIDILGFNPHHRNSNIIMQGNRWHGSNFSEVTQLIFDKAGIDWDVSRKLKHILLHNYVIAKSEIYEKYVTEILEPCMSVMSNDSEVRELVWKDSGYHKKRRMSEKLKADLGVNYYPLHTFICERFWSVFVALNPEYIVKQY